MNPCGCREIVSYEGQAGLVTAGDLFLQKNDFIESNFGGLKCALNDVLRSEWRQSLEQPSDVCVFGWCDIAEIERLQRQPREAIRQADKGCLCSVLKIKLVLAHVGFSGAYLSKGRDSTSLGKQLSLIQGAG
jgi:hypothetical protein